MNRIFLPTLGASDWRKLLADPEAHWARKASALEAAVSWECAQKKARGLPTEIAAAIDQQPELEGAHLLVAMPEHKVPLKGRGKASQSDVWALLKSDAGYISMAVEAKAGEPFASTIEEWLKAASDGKKERLDYLCNILRASAPPAPSLRYQLFHRTVSAILEAQRFNAPFAVMIVQSFREDEQAWGDFKAFCEFLGTAAVRKGIAEVPRTGSERLFLAWADCETASDSEMASVL